MPCENYSKLLVSTLPSPVSRVAVDNETQGAIAEIDMDLISLRKYIEENTEPGPNPILNLQKGTILEMWEELDREGECKRCTLFFFFFYKARAANNSVAKKFKSNFVDTA